MTHYRLAIFTLLAASLLSVVPSGRGALAGDPLDSLTPMSTSALRSTTFQNNMFTIQHLTADSTVSGNTVSAVNGGQVINGTIAGNVVANNRGITTVLQNTGNNVSFNNALVLNLNLTH